MSDIRVLAEHVAKSFRVLKYHKTTFRALQRWLQRQPSHASYWVLRDVCLTIYKGEKVALIGRNGSGKSTLLRLMTGIYDSDGGILRVHERPSALFDASVGVVGTLSVTDNVYLYGALHGISRGTLRPKVADLLAQAGLTHLQFSPFRDLSLGQRQRFALSVFFQGENDFVIFDEALSNIDRAFWSSCERYFSRLLGNAAATMIMTSHDASLLRRYCRRAVWLEHGAVRQDGPVNEVLDAYEQSFREENGVV